MASRLHELSGRGVSVWVDTLSREMLVSGELARLIHEDSIVGLTSNPTIFEKALSEGDLYDEQLLAVLDEVDDPKEVFVRLAIKDVQDACDLMRPVWERTAGVDGRVSIEVDPDLAYEREASFAEAMRLHELGDRPNLYVKIPGTEPGLGAIEDCIAAGRSINVTLIFSLARHAAVAEAYVRGVERFLESGGDVAKVSSVASFFVSRVDTEADRRLSELGREDLQGRLAVANARLAYQQYLDVFAGERWERLAALGAHPQRCLWASTSTKNPAYSDVLYVEGVDEARTLLDELAEAGVDYDDVVGTLEREGVQKFSDSFASLIGGIESKRAALAV